MKRLLISVIAGVVVVAVAVTIALAAGGGGGGSSSTGASGTKTPGGATVSSQQISGSGNVLVDSSGMALYANDQESGGMALCTGACLSFWTPLTVSGTPTKDSSVTGKLSVVARPDGTKQVTFDGKLLYTFYEDQPGQVAGDGFVDAFGGQKFTWHVVNATKTSSSTPSSSTPSGPLGY